MSAKNEHGLTPQQEKFAQCVASGKSLSDAYRASYKAQRMTDKQIHEEASKLASAPKVSQRIRGLQAESAEKAVLDAATVLEEVRRMATSDIAGIMHPDGRVKLPHELDAATRAAVASFKIDEYGRVEYKFWDKNSAIEKAMKHLGLFKEDNSQKPPALVGEVRLVGLTPKAE